LPGVFIDLGQTRDYPEGSLMSHIIGYTGRVSDEDLNGRDDPLLSLPTMRFGKKGIERSLEDDLRGRAGAVQVEVNAVGRVVRELDRNRPDAVAPSALASFAAEHHVGAILVDARVESRWRPFLRPLGARPVTVGGIALYRLSTQSSKPPTNARTPPSRTSRMRSGIRSRR
jgi:hypothetical protein